MPDYRDYMVGGLFPVESLLLSYDDDEIPGMLEEIEKNYKDMPVAINRGTIKKQFGDKWQEYEKDMQSRGWHIRDEVTYPLAVEQLLEQSGGNNELVQKTLDRAEKIGYPVSVTRPTIDRDFGEDADAIANDMQGRGYFVFPDEDTRSAAYGAIAQQRSRLSQGVSMRPQTEEEKRQDMQGIQQDIKIFQKVMEERHGDFVNRTQKKAELPTTYAEEPNFFKRTMNRFLEAPREPLIHATDFFRSLDSIGEAWKSTGNIVYNATNQLAGAITGNPQRYKELLSHSEGYDRDFGNIFKVANQAASALFVKPIMAFSFIGAFNNALVDASASMRGGAMQDIATPSENDPAYAEWSRDVMGAAVGSIGKAGSWLWQQMGGSEETGNEFGNMFVILAMEGAVKGGKSMLTSAKGKLATGKKLTPQEAEAVKVVTGGVTKPTTESLAKINQAIESLDQTGKVVEGAKNIGELESRQKYASDPNYKEAVRQIRTPEELREYTAKIEQARQADPMAYEADKFSRMSEEMQVAKLESAVNREGEAKIGELERFVERPIDERVTEESLSPDPYLAERAQRLKERQAREDAEALEALRLANEDIHKADEVKQQEVPRAESVGAKVEGAGPQEGIEGQAGGRASLRDVAEDRMEAQEAAANQPPPEPVRPPSQPARIELPPKNRMAIPDDVSVEVKGQRVNYSQLPPERQAQLRELSDTILNAETGKETDVGITLERARRFAKKMESDARGTIEDLGGLKGMGITGERDALVQFEYIKLGAAKILQGLTDYRMWRHDMIRNYAHLGITQHVNKIWGDAQALALWAQQAQRAGTPWADALQIWMDDKFATLNVPKPKAGTPGPQAVRKIDIGGPKDVEGNVVYDPSIPVAAQLKRKLIGSGKLMPGEQYINRFGTRFHQFWVNVMRPAEKLIDKAIETGFIEKVLPENDFRILQRMLGRVYETSKDAILNGIPDPNGTGRLTGGFAEMYEPLGQVNTVKFETARREYTQYHIARDTVERMQIFEDRMNTAIATINANPRMNAKQKADAIKKAQKVFAKKQAQDANNAISGIGKNSGMSDTDFAKDLINTVKADPNKYGNYETVLKNYVDWSHALLYYLKEQGRISDEQYANLTSTHTSYAKMNRFFDGIDKKFYEESGTKQGGGVGQKKKVIHPFKGSGREMMDPAVSLLTSTYQILREGNRNNIMRAFRDVFQEGRLAEAETGQATWLNSFGRQVKKGTPGAIEIYVNGKPEYWMFEDAIHSAFKMYDTPAPMPGFLTMLPRAMRATVVNSPPFAIRNLIRDAFERPVLSEHGSKPWDSLKPITEQELSDIRRYGGVTGWMFQSPDNYYRLQKKLMHDHGFNKDGVWVTRELWEKYKDKLYTSELRGRVGEFRRAKEYAQKKLGYDEFNANLYAADKAGDLPNFSQAGYYMKWINQVVPFSNAAVQGAYRWMRAVKNNPGKATAAFATYILAPKIAEYLWNSQNPQMLSDWQNLEDYRKNMFLNFQITPGVWAKIPMGFESAVLAAGVTRMIDAAVNKNPDAFNMNYAANAVGAFIPFDQADIAGPLGTELEALSNYSFFYDRHIVPAHEENLALSDRKGAKKAPVVAQWLGSALNQDPRIIDHLMKGHFTNMYKMAATPVDVMTGNRGLEDLVQSYIGLTAGDPGSAAPVVQRVWELARKHRLENRRELRQFGDQIKLSYTAKTLEEKQKAKQEFLRSAKVLLQYLEAYDKNKK